MLAAFQRVLKLLIAITCAVLVNFELYAKQELPAVVNMAVDGYMPFVSNSTNSNQLPGYMVEMTRRILAEHNVKLQLVNIPLARSIKTGSNVSLDGVFAQSEDDAKFFEPRGSHGVSRVCMFKYANSKVDFSDLQNVKIGLYAGYSLVHLPEFSDVQRMLESDDNTIVRITGDNPIPRYIKLLQNGRVDIFIENDYVVRWYLRGPSRENIDAFRCSKGHQLFTMFFKTSPAGKELSEILGRGIEKMRQNGELQTILSKYSIEDWL